MAKKAKKNEYSIEDIEEMVEDINNANLFDELIDLEGIDDVSAAVEAVKDVVMEEGECQVYDTDDLTKESFALLEKIGCPASSDSDTKEPEEEESEEEESEEEEKPRSTKKKPSVKKAKPMEPEEEEEKPKKKTLPKKGKPPAEKKKEKTPTRGFKANPKVAERRKFEEKLISTGTNTRKDIIKKVTEEFPVSESTVNTELTDGKNPKYNKFSKLVVEDEKTKILCFEK